MELGFSERHASKGECRIFGKMAARHDDVRDPKKLWD